MEYFQEDEDVQAVEQAANDSDYELMELREQISMLTKQFYHDRQKWLEEKRRLEEAAKHALAGDDARQGARHERAGSSMLTGSDTGSDTGREDASQGSAREPSTSTSFASSRSASPNQTGSAVSAASTANVSISGTQPELLTALADLQRQLEESRRQQESASVRWTLEREALQRQIHALISFSAEADGTASAGGAGEEGRDGAAARGSSSPGDDDERLRLTDRVSELEALVEDLQAERENLEEHLRVLAADAARGRLSARVTADSAPPPPPPPSVAAPCSEAGTPRAQQQPPPASASDRRSGDGGGGGAFHAPTFRDSVSVAELLSEKAELERELRRFSQECVAVSRSEYAELCSLRNQMTFLVAETQQLREEAAEAARLQAEAELAQAAQDGVLVPQEEYQRLMQLRALSRGTASAPPAPAEGGRSDPVECPSSLPSSPHDGAQSVPLEEHRRLLAAVQERDALADQVTVLQRKLLAAEGARALRETAEEVDRRRAQEAAEAQAGDGAAAGDAALFGDAAASGAAAAAAGGVYEAEMQSELFVLREQLAAVVAASVAESGRWAAQVAELQEEVETLRNRNAALVTDLGAVRHALAAGQVQASEAARAAAAAAEAGRADAVRELAEARRRIAALEEELAAAHREAQAALQARERLSVEAEVARDAALRTRDALANCLEQRISEGGSAGGEATGPADAGAAAAVGVVAAAAAAAAGGSALHAALLTEGELAAARARIRVLEAELADAQAEAAVVSRQLEAARGELAEARELGLLFQASRRDVLPQSKRVVRGLPQEWIQSQRGVSSGGGAGGGAGGGERRGPSTVGAAVATAAATGPTAHPVVLGLAGMEGDGEDSVAGSVDPGDEAGTAVSTL